MDRTTVKMEKKPFRLLLLLLSCYDEHVTSYKLHLTAKRQFNFKDS